MTLTRPRQRGTLRARRPSARAPGILLLLVAAALAFSAVAQTGTGAGGSGAATFTDPAGDSQGGPDVTGVTVTGDATTGTITVSVTAAAFMRASTADPERDVLVWLDTDRNAATGDPTDGTDYVLAAWSDSTGLWWNVGHWDGTSWHVEPAPSPTMGFTRSGDVLAWTVSAADLGGATGFRFYVLAGIWSDADNKYIAEDDAPDSGWWDYDLATDTPAPQPTPAPPADKVKLRIFAPATTPKTVTAGRRISVSFPVYFERQESVIVVSSSGTRTDTMVIMEPVSSARLVCDPSVSGKVIAHSESFGNGKARLSFLVPKRAKGKLLTVRVKVTATDRKSGKTMTAARVATFRIR